MPHAQGKGLARENEEAPSLPTTLLEALTALAQDRALQDVLGEQFVATYIKIKQQELARQTVYVSANSSVPAEQAVRDWQCREYLEYY